MNSHRDHQANTLRNVEIEGLRIWYYLNDEQYDEIYYRKELKEQVLEADEGEKWIKEVIIGEITNNDLI